MATLDEIPAPSSVADILPIIVWEAKRVNMESGAQRRQVQRRSDVFSASIQLPLVDGHPEPTIVAEEEIDFPIVQSDAIDAGIEKKLHAPTSMESGSIRSCPTSR